MEAPGGSKWCKLREHVDISARENQGKGHCHHRAQHHGRHRTSSWQSQQASGHGIMLLWVTTGDQDLDFWRPHGAGENVPAPQDPSTQPSPEAAVVGVIMFRQQLTQGPVNDDQGNSKLATVIGVSPLSAE